MLDEGYITVEEYNATSVERRNRIRVCIAAYAYEIEADPIMEDKEFDDLCLQIDTSVKTGSREMDRWFRKNFDPWTGQWVHKHPNKEYLAAKAQQIRSWRRPKMPENNPKKIGDFTLDHHPEPNTVSIQSPSALIIIPAHSVKAIAEELLARVAELEKAKKKPAKKAKKKKVEEDDSWLDGDDDSWME